MKNQNRNIMPRLCLLAGIALIIASAAVLFLWQRGIYSSEQKSAAYAQTIRALIPEPQGAVPEERSDNTMSVLSLDGTDFVGILEIPRHHSTLPVCADWSRLNQHPCLFSGSIYDRTIQIGGTSQKGQYDFYREISVGDQVFFTDMEGNRYAYEVTDLRYEKHADQAALQRKDAALTLFIKNIYAFEYIIVFCDVAG